MELINKDLISRSLAIDYLTTKANVDGAYGYIGTKEIYDYLSELPSAEPERQRGSWIFITTSLKGDGFYVCSKCGRIVPEVRNGGWDFCPSCGADMRGKKNG